MIRICFFGQSADAKAIPLGSLLPDDDWYRSVGNRKVALSQLLCRSRLVGPVPLRRTQFFFSNREQLGVHRALEWGFRYQDMMIMGWSRNFRSFSGAKEGELSRVFLKTLVSSVSGPLPPCGTIGKYGKGLSRAKGQILVQFPLPSTLTADILSPSQLVRRGFHTLAGSNVVIFSGEPRPLPLRWRYPLLSAVQTVRQKRVKKCLHVR